MHSVNRAQCSRKLHAHTMWANLQIAWAPVLNLWSRHTSVSDCQTGMKATNALKAQVLCCQSYS